LVRETNLEKRFKKGVLGAGPLGRAGIECYTEERNMVIDRNSRVKI